MALSRGRPPVQSVLHRFRSCHGTPGTAEYRERHGSRSIGGRVTLAGHAPALQRAVAFCVAVRLLRSAEDIGCDCCCRSGRQMRSLASGGGRCSYRRHGPVCPCGREQWPGTLFIGRPHLACGFGAGGCDPMVSDSRGASAASPWSRMRSSSRSKARSGIGSSGKCARTSSSTASRERSPSRCTRMRMSATSLAGLLAMTFIASKCSGGDTMTRRLRPAYTVRPVPAREDM